MERICPSCEDIRNVTLITQKEVLKVKKEDIEVDIDFYQCSTCNESFTVVGENIDPVAEANRKYRERHNFIQPEEIKTEREALGLTQRELSELLGMSVATLNRYEKGALQEETHNNLLKDALKEGCILNRLHEKPDILSEEKKQYIYNLVKKKALFSCNLEVFFESNPRNQEGNLFNGNRKVELDRLINTIVLFCDQGLSKTKLNKYLFYADFYCHNKLSTSLTGLQYAHLPYGPCPDNYEFIYSCLENQGFITSEQEEIFKDDEAFLKTIYKGSITPDTSLFTSSELEIIYHIKSLFEKMTTRELSDLSHKELGYKNTEISTLISYEYSKQLLIG